MDTKEEKLATSIPLLHVLESEQKEVEKDKRMPQLLCTLSICLLGMSGGAIMCWPASALPEIQHPNSTLTLTITEGSWVVSLIAVGSVPGAFLAGFLAEKFGRRATALFQAGPILLSWILISVGHNVWFLYIARFLGGTSVGGTGVIAPMYISEIAGRKRRATLVALYPLSLSLGMLLSLSLSTILTYRFLSIAIASVAVFFLITFFFAPESPVYQVLKGDLTSAKRSLDFFYGKARSGRILEETINMINSTSSSEKLTLGKLIKDKAFVKGLIISLGIMAELQLCGINFITAYSEKIFKELNSSVDPKLASNIIFGVQVLAGCTQLFIINKFPRKVLLLQNSILAFFTLTILGLQNLLGWEAGWLPVVCLVVFSLSFMWGFGALCFTVMAEVFSSKAREIAFSLSIVLMWSLNFSVTKSFPMLLTTIGIGWTLLIFAGFMFASGFHIIFIVVETRGKTLKEIQDELYGKSKPNQKT